MKKNILSEQRVILSKFSNIFQYLTEKNKIILPASLIILFGLTNILFTNSSIDSVSALEYQSSTPVSFTVNPTVSISVSGDLVISNLSPGSSSDSNIITVTASSNAIAGYTLYANVGNNTHTSPSFNTTNLTHTNNTNTLTSLSTNDSITDLNTLDTTTNGKWGYSYSLDNGTTWINSTGNTGYSGLPLYSLGTDSELVSQTDNTTTNLDFKIGAKANQSQVAGEYTNIINFIALANNNPEYVTLDEATYMQDNISCVATAEGATNTLTDIRDGSTYTVRKINGLCWMTQNLRITGTISAEYSNFEGEDFNVSEYSLDSNDTSFANHCDRTNGYYHACAKDSNNTITGVWYNFYSASVGTYNLTSEDGYSIIEDICPANWHLPTGPGIASGTDFNRLIGNAISGWQSVTTGIIDFNAVTGGSYIGGSHRYTDQGFWWSSTTQFSGVGNNLCFNSTTNQVNGNPNFSVSLYVGDYIRCVRSD